MEWMVLYTAKTNTGTIYPKYGVLYTSKNRVLLTPSKNKGIVYQKKN
jgi:hypothetical protein